MFVKFESIGKDIIATNEPTRILCGAPDFNITRGKVPLGHVETKDIGENLDLMQRGKPPHGEQFGRYRDGLPNWILTDYLQFRWFVNGEKRLTVSLAELDAKGKVKAKRFAFNSEGRRVDEKTLGGSSLELEAIPKK